jgi:hypothetical protein
MDAWVWIVLLLIIVAVVAALWYTRAQKKRTEHLRERFGPEYDRAVGASDGKRQAETELQERAKRRERLDIVGLEPEARERYETSWRDVQARFVDEPEKAVSAADGLVQEVMKERGYPMESFEQREADISVDHPEVTQDYRAAHGISLANDHGEASTEDLRQAMVHYRSLFQRLLAPEPGARKAP